MAEFSQLVSAQTKAQMQDLGSQMIWALPKVMGHSSDRIGVMMILSY